MLKSSLTPILGFPGDQSEMMKIDEDEKDRRVICFLQGKSYLLWRTLRVVEGDGGDCPAFMNSASCMMLMAKDQESLDSRFTQAQKN